MPAHDRTDEHTVDPASGTVGSRKIIHIDMDAFYASVEQRDNPELCGKPVAVGGSQARGVVAAASYEARKFGVHSAMPSITAKRKCPELIFVKPRFDTYKAISLQIREIFAEYTSAIEPLSLDEAYLDVTENLKGMGSATQIAAEIRKRIRTETNLTASAGVSYNKFLAKLPRTIASLTGSSSSPPKWGRPSSKPCRSGSFMASGRRRRKRCSNSGSEPVST
jgi:DNA polymerase IV